jgi:hypothetical protein
MNVPWIRMPMSWQSFVKRRARSIETPFLMFFRIWSFPDS